MSMLQVICCTLYLGVIKVFFIIMSQLGRAVNRST